MANRNLLLSLIKKKFGTFKGSGDQLAVNCPYCEHRGFTRNTTYKLGIHLGKKVYHCFKCDVKGKVENLFPQLAAMETAAGEVFRRGEELKESSENQLEPLPVFQTLNALNPPWSDLVFKFLHDKGFPPATVDRKIFFVQDYRKKDFSFGPRLLFPIYQFDTYRGFQARTIYKNTDPKYIGASNMDRRSILYNFDTAFKQKERLVICEGFFDQMRVGDTAIATLGKIITENQIRLIKLGEFKRVIVFLDKDAKKEAYEIADKLKRYFPTYMAVPDWDRLPLLPNGQKKKDPGDLIKEEINVVLNHKLERRF